MRVTTRTRKDKTVDIEIVTKDEFISLANKKELCSDKKYLIISRGSSKRISALIKIIKACDDEEKKGEQP